MKKLNYSEIKDQQLIDLRSQVEYQVGHAKNALNLNPGNFKKYAPAFFTADQPITFVVASEDSAVLEELATSAQELGFTQITGFILAGDIPATASETTDTISAADFLNLEDDFVLLDVRNPAEITRPAPEKNLISIPFEDLPNSYQTLDNDKVIYPVCGSGNRGTAAASYLSGKGFKVAVIAGGMKAIQEAQD